MANEFKVKKGLIVQGSGSTGDTTILDVQGNQGQLFSITDSLEGTLFSVSDISGIPILDVNSNETVKIGTFGNEGIIVNGSNVTSSGNISASGTITANSFVGAFTGAVTGDATGLTGTPDIIVGSLTATSITSSIVTSSIIYTEGSNIFGDAEDDTHLFNGHITASGNISASGTITANAFVGSGASLTSLPSQTDNNFTTTLKNKLDAIEASADVTDTTNVTAAGALMDSELSSITDVKALNQSVISGATPTFTTTNFTDASNKRLMTDAQETKLDSVESSADVTDTTNVTAAGALMDSELTSIANVKALNQSVVSGATPTFTTTNFTDASNKRLMTDAQETKLDSVESSADVTDATNVTAAGALMDSELSEIATVKALTGAGISGSFTAASASFSTRVTANDAKLTANTTNVTSAGALMDSELTSIADVKALNQSVVSGATPTFTTTNFTDASNKRLMTDAQETKLDSVESSADVTDTTNVTAAGALMDSELSGIAHVKSLNQSLTTTATPTFGTLTTTNGTIFGEEGGTHQFTGNITASGNISSSGTIVGSNLSGTNTGDQSTSDVLTLIEDGVDSVHYKDGSIDTIHIADDQVTFAKASGVSPNIYGSIIKLLPSDFASNIDGGNTKFGVGYTDTAGSAYGMKVGAAEAELFAFVSIPEGMKATHVDVFDKDSRALEVFEVQINATSLTSKGSGNCNTTLDITDVNATATNFLAIKITTTATTDKVFGGQVTIAAI
jgi:hypothetical protein